MSLKSNDFEVRKTAGFFYTQISIYCISLNNTTKYAAFKAKKVVTENFESVIILLNQKKRIDFDNPPGKTRGGDLTCCSITIVSVQSYQTKFSKTKNIL